MKKFNKLTAIILACAMMLMMAACGSKTYSSLEEWYSDNPAYEKTMQTMLSSQKADGLSMEFDIQDNSLVYRYIYDQAVFGQSEEIDAAAKELLDSALEQQKSNFTQGIDEIAKASKIDASTISVVLEYYNPGESAPSYSQTITK